jgi:hypothetical protein
MNIKIKEAGVAIFIMLVIFQDAIARYISAFSYLDEILGIFGFIGILFLIFSGRLTKKEYTLLLFCIISYAICFLSALHSEVYYSIKYVIQDSFLLYKGFLVGIGFYYFFGHSRCDFKTILKYLANLIKLVAIVMFVCCVANLVVDFGMSDTSTRYGMRVYRFVFEHCGGLNLACVSMLCLFSYHIFTRQSQRKDFIYVIMLMFSMALTLRTRAFLFIVIYFALLYCLNTKKKHVKLFAAIATLVVGLFISMDQLESYYSAGGTNARNMLLRYSFVTANRYFPFGSGFSTYGTYTAVQNYSKLYYQYGFDTVYGMSNGFYLFATDNYIAAIIGEFGYFGTFFFALSWYCLFRLFIEKNFSKTAKFSILFGALSFAVSGLVAGTLYHIIPLALCFACIHAAERKEVLIRYATKDH